MTFPPPFPGAYTAPPWCIAVVLAAWLATGIYFIASAFATQRIQKKEAGSRRTGDNLVLWGGYILLFFRATTTAAWNQAFLPPTVWGAAAKSGLVIALCGLALTCWARATLGRYWSRIVALKQDHKLVQHGPYRLVRHPLYSGLLLATLGTTLAFGLWHALLGAALLWIGFISRAAREDALLAGHFGAEFEAYRARSGRLAPRLARRT